MTAAARATGWLAVRQVRRGAVIVTAVCAGMSALVAAQYRSTFSGEMSQGAVAALAENPAIRVLFGPAVALDDPGGFTVWRTGTPVMVLAGVWLMLAAIRITRGEEDAGRWDLLLAGRARAVDVLVRCAVVITGTALLISAGIGLAMVAAGTDVTGAVVYALGALGVTATFGAMGLLSAQVMPSRSSAVGLGAGVLGAALLLRMLADGIGALAFAAWSTPFGLVGRAAPYAQNRPLPLAVLMVFAVVITATAVAAARGRDVGGGWVSVRGRRAPRTRLLRSVGSFGVRRALRPTLGWLAAVGTYFLIVGATIASILDFFAQNPRFGDLAAGAGFSGLDTAAGFAAALFSLLVIPTGLYAATRLAALVADERAQRWTTVFAAPVSRPGLLGAEVAVTVAGVLALHLAAAVAMWAGALLTGAPLGLSEALAGALNTAPVAWLALGAAALAVGWLHTSVTAVGALPVVGGFLLTVLTDSIAAPQWMSELSPFAHVAATPAAPPDWSAIAVFAVIGGAATLAGVAGYRRRDLAT
ncbi:polyketide antibiotic transporter [Mycolicibacterium sp. S2-37]|uniref:polyketide antibiotic transporter n=1 Tax=Mycolicibacterium sp. S2-37 TaxID=2810297 RepID=UPI001A93D406|nr:polyketide antibiotic transporter [Mycolicibacterium sp. S2-37]MBO0676955.1 polyketide antibiotic transporter [Mycolicibacterium sp. S2-37]